MIDSVEVPMLLIRGFSTSHRRIFFFEKRCIEQDYWIFKVMPNFDKHLMPGFNILLSAFPNSGRSITPATSRKHRERSWCCFLGYS